LSVPEPSLHLISCEYLPEVGGVADHTRALASALGAAGVSVHVWSPFASVGPGEAPGVEVHPLPDRFGPASLRALDLQLGNHPAPRRLFIQWVPHGFGQQSLNVGFCNWVLRRARRHGDCVEIMVHEPYLAFDLRRARQSGAAFVHRVMLATLLAAAARVWVATPSFERYVRPYGFGRRLGYHWLPVGSPLAVSPDPEQVARIASTWRRPVVAHLGTFSPLVTATLAPVIDQVVTARPDVTWLLLGRGSDEFARDIASSLPHAAGRVSGTGTLDVPLLAAYLAAADLFVQPYPDGVTARRTTAGAILAHGRAMVTTDGHLTESFWRIDRAVRLAPAGDPEAIACSTLELLADPLARERLGARALTVAAQRFSTSRAVATLTAALS
jgi:glycosyltransferase involved in cell wall biosynthesis